MMDILRSEVALLASQGRSSLAEALALLDGGDALGALTVARRESASDWAVLRDSPEFDSLTYWDSVPEELEAAYACSALCSAQAERSLG